MGIEKVLKCGVGCGIMAMASFVVSANAIQPGPPEDCYTTSYNGPCGTSADHGSQVCQCNGGATVTIPAYRTVAGRVENCADAVGEGFSGCVEQGKTICEQRIDYECGGSDGCTATPIGDPENTDFCCKTASLSEPSCNGDPQ